MKNMSPFDLHDRKKIESLGLNCIFIDEFNKDMPKKYLDYFDTENSFTKNAKNYWESPLLDDSYEQIGIDTNHLPILVVDPAYFHEVYIDIIKKYNVKTLILSISHVALLTKQKVERKTLTTLNFLTEIPHLKQFYLDGLKGILFDYWDIKDFSPLESLANLEYLSIYNNTTYVDIDYSKLKKLRNVRIYHPKENKTIYKCHHIEKISTRYYEKSLDSIKEWKNLIYLDAYFDNLTSLSELSYFGRLEVLRGEFTSSLKTFQGANSQSLKSFFYYTEARNTPTTLQGISGFKNLEVLSICCLKKLESIADLIQCEHLKEFRLEESNVPNDIEDIVKIKNIQLFKVDYGVEVAKKYPKLKDLIYSNYPKSTYENQTRL